MKSSAYLDYNATAPARPEVLALMKALMVLPLNASAVHSLGREGRKYVEGARRAVADLVGADPSNVIFNSGATEGNNTVLGHFTGRVLVSAIEHPSVLAVRPDATLIPVKATGELDLQALETLLRAEPKTALVSVMLANNETGVVQPVAEAAALASRWGAWLHCDAVQAAGKIPFDIQALGAHFLTLSSHKIGGPQGVGALVLGQCGETPTLLKGGGQEKKTRAGTENVAGIAGFGLAASLAQEGLSNAPAIARLRDFLEAELAHLYPGLCIYGQKAMRLPNTSLFTVPGAKAETLLMGLDLAGFCVSNGSACASGKVEASHVLAAMGVSPSGAASALRVSIGQGTTQAEIEGLILALKRLRPAG